MLGKNLKLKFQLILSTFSILLFFISPMSAAITVENTSSGAGSDTITGVTSLTFSHTVNSCANCALYVTISTFTQTNFPSSRVNTAAITYAGQALTSVGTKVAPFPTAPATGNSSVEVFRLISPPVGTGSVVVNFIVPVNYTVGAAISLNGVSQLIPNGSPTTLSGSAKSFSADITGTVSTDLVIDTLSAGPNAIFLTEEEDQIVCANLDETSCLRGRRFFVNAFDVGSTSRKPALSRMTPMFWRLSSTQSYAYIGFPVRQFIVTAAAVSVGGKVSDGNGRPIGKARILITDGRGETRVAVSSPFGFFRFENLQAGETYIFSVTSKNHQFSPQVINVTEGSSELNFTAK